jgi:hypothetical protein
MDIRREMDALHQAIKDWLLMLMMKLLCVDLTFLVYLLYAGIGPSFGCGKLRLRLFEPPEPIHRPGSEG